MFHLTLDQCSLLAHLLLTEVAEALHDERRITPTRRVVATGSEPPPLPAQPCALRDKRLVFSLTQGPLLHEALTLTPTQRQVRLLLRLRWRSLPWVAQGAACPEPRIECT